MTAPGVLESDSYGVALRLAREALRTRDPFAVAERCRVDWIPSSPGAVQDAPRGEFRVRYLAEDLVVSLPDARVAAAAPVEAGAATVRVEASIWDAILILHYLASTAPPPPRGDPIAFADLADGRFYDAAFQGRCRVPLLRHFGADPARLLRIAGMLDAVPWDRGDASIMLRALPRVDVYAVVYRGDDEFPPGGSLLFSSDVAAFLSTEDIAVLGGAAVSRLGRAWKRVGELP